mmetsp:Transcript_3051/g.10093  ORF Transcript_3051/g.10093 Transcript_3051/m.10093 type:complete len:257 (+) Transcript_3051:978-1748(+)
MRQSIASSGSGGTRSDATDPPGLLSTIFWSVECRRTPMVSAKLSEMLAYAMSSASDFPFPTPTLSTFFPPSTYAVTVAVHPPFEDLCSAFGLDEFASSSIKRPISDRFFCCALRCSFNIFATFGGALGSISPPVAATMPSNSDAIASRCDSAFAKAIPTPWTSYVGGAAAAAAEDETSTVAAEVASCPRRPRGPRSSTLFLIVTAPTPISPAAAALAIASPSRATSPRSFHAAGIASVISHANIRLCGGPCPENAT